MSQKYIIIPARLNSSRLPNKLLLKKGDSTVLDYAIRNAIQSLCHDNVILATDSDELEEIGNIWGIKVFRSPYPHLSGTSRVIEAAKNLNLHDSDVVVNLQADCVEIDQEAIGFCLEANYYNGINSCYYRARQSEIDNPNCVKVVLNNWNEAMYFSRCSIPYGTSYKFIHIGIYGFTKKFIDNYLYLPDCIYSNVEKLEQLQWLAEKYPIYMKECGRATHIDTQEDYDKWIKS